MEGALDRPQGLATIWGDERPRLRPHDAALVNGAAAHAFELDDFNAKLHPGAVVIPAAIALAEARGVGGDTLETAIAAGYEVMIRTSLALEPSEGRRRGWHLTAVCGTLGAAAAASVILDLDPEMTAWALGLAGTQSGGLFAFNADGANSKRLHPGRAAQAGIMAAELAERGLSGPTQVLEAPDGGLLWAFSDAAQLAPLVDGLGQRWHALDTLIKPYACCGSLHAHVDSAVALRPHYRRGARVRAGVAQVIDLQCGYPYDPGSELNAQMSLRYCVAAALLDGAALPDQFTPARIADPEITRLAKSIEIVREPEHDRIYPARYPGWVEIETEPGSGRFKREQRLDPSGHPGNPARRSTLLTKYHALADPQIGRDSAERLEAAATTVGELNVRGLVEFMTLPETSIASNG
jgi:2-methylcitrate dehydratase PrpD